MREILFRGKSIYTKVWIYGYLTSKDCIEEVDVIPETVSQFTGLLDKNGKKIFDNDKTNIGIVKYYCGSFIVEEEDAYCSLLELSNNEETHCDLEIIGNIHE